MLKNARPQLKRKKIGIKELPLASRPREKILHLGQQTLSNEELFALLLGTGTPSRNVLSLSAALLKRFPLETLLVTPPEALVAFPGVGKAKASRILAAMELGNRLFAPQSLTKVVIRSLNDAVAELRDIADKRQEFVVVLYLNARSELLVREIVGQGSLTGMLLTAREIFAPALKLPCASLIIAHNHPSGDPTPSEDDIAFTSRIQEAGEVMGIPMLDHVIVTKQGYFSFRENKKS
jgi:DNA repair protein RadC